jgi:leucyl-tRNA synthetase
MEMVNGLYLFAEARGVRPAGREDEPPPIIERLETAAVLREAVEALVLLMSPFTPHLSEELWERLGYTNGVVAAGWPAFDEDAAREQEIEIAVQVNGKVRGRIMVPAGASEDEHRAAALGSPLFASHLDGMDVVKVVVAVGRLVNIVVRAKK